MSGLWHIIRIVQAEASALSCPANRDCTLAHPSPLRWPIKITSKINCLRIGLYKLSAQETCNALKGSFLFQRFPITSTNRCLVLFLRYNVTIDMNRSRLLQKNEIFFAEVEIELVSVDT